jgi:ParB-like chromosome segregation protein Spo0J
MNDNLTKFQSFTTKTINRSQIKNAPYNPRVISEDAKKRLRKIIKENGLVATITVNQRSMNIVGGHQRISVLDSLEKREDYDLTVAMIDVDDKQERKLNIILNNQSIGGEYDLPKLQELFKENEFDFKEIGFTIEDLNIMDIMVQDFKETPEAQSVVDDLQSIVESTQEDREIEKEIKKEALAGVKEAQKLQREANDQESADQQNSFVIITFTSTSEKEAFLQALGLNNGVKYISSNVMRQFVQYP